MAIFSFFKLPGYRSFDFQPRFYDEKKNLRNQRFKDLMDDQDVEDNGYKPEMKVRISRENLYKNRRANTYSQMRVMLIVFLLLLVCYIFLMDDLLRLIL